MLAAASGHVPHVEFLSNTQKRSSERTHFGQFLDECIARQTNKSVQRQTKLVSAQWTFDDVVTSLVHSNAFQTRQTKRVHARQLTWARVNLNTIVTTITRSSATAEIARDAETVIQGHSRSSVVVPIDAAYMTA